MTGRYGDRYDDGLEERVYEEDCRRHPCPLSIVTVSREAIGGYMRKTDDMVGLSGGKKSEGL